MAELQLFACTRRNARLTTVACSKFYAAALRKKPEPWDANFKCRACPVGAVHAGGGTTPIQDEAAKEAAARQQVVDEWKNVCPRCLRLSSRIVKDKLCISCYNRAREVRVGKNRKGTAPKLLPSKLCTVTLRIIDSEGSRVETFDNVTGPEEVMAAVARRAAGAVGFGRVVEPVLDGAALEAWCQQVERAERDRRNAARKALRLDRDRRHRPGGGRDVPTVPVVAVQAPSRRRHTRRAAVVEYQDAAD